MVALVLVKRHWPRRRRRRRMRLKRDGSRCCCGGEFGMLGKICEDENDGFGFL